MTQEELKVRYATLYDNMSVSRNPEDMKVFGAVMNEMMDWMIQNKSEAAREWIEKLDSIRWKNYLTTKEAEAIVADMDPVAPWSRDVWRNAMESFGLALEEYPCYNKCALWVEMNKVYSDSAETIAKIMGLPLQDVGTEEMVRAVHAFAMDNLKDADGVYSIRHYFDV